MAYDFTKLSDIDVIDELSNDATVYVENDGKVARTSMRNIKGTSSGGVFLLNPIRIGGSNNMYIVSDEDAMSLSESVLNGCNTIFVNLNSSLSEDESFPGSSAYSVFNSIGEQIFLLESINEGLFVLAVANLIDLSLTQSYIVNERACEMILNPDSQSSLGALKL